MATAGRPGGATGTRTPAQLFALVFGAVYLLVGLVGFAATGFDDFFQVTAQSVEDKLLIFHLTPFHNVVHLAIGAVWLGAAANHATAKTANLGIGAVYLLVALLGFLEVQFVMELLNIHGASDADNFLHLVSGAAGVFFGTVGAEGTTGRTTTTA